MQELPYRLERTVVIKARPETVFRFFTDNARWAAWWRAGSTIDATPGGRMYIRHAGGVESIGEVVEVVAPERIVFTYGFAGGKPIPPGSSLVTIRLEPDAGGTRLHLQHDFPEAGPRDEHIQGWRFQLALFSNAVTNEVYADAARTVDAWYEAWSIHDNPTREASFSRIVTADIRFRDRYSLLDGLDDLVAHTGAALRFMPGIGLARKGAIRHCQGNVLADWVAMDGEGKERVSGTSVFALSPEGRVESVIGFTNP